MSSQTEEWKVDKKVPLALIVTLAIQTAGVFFWMGQLTIRIDHLENQVLLATTNNDRLIRVEVQLETIFSSLQRIEDQLETNR